MIPYSMTETVKFLPEVGSPIELQARELDERAKHIENLSIRLRKDRNAFLREQVYKFWTIEDWQAARLARHNEIKEIISRKGNPNRA